MEHEALGRDSLVGQSLGRYHIVEKIGEGGMSVVYRAHDERLDRDVALKILTEGSLADSSARERFRKEALVLSKLNHANVAAVYDFDTCEGIDFLAEELVDGSSLNEILIKGPLSEKQCITLGSQLCEGLTAAHDWGILHRDVKPGNIRVTEEGQVKILDFGLAKVLGAPARRAAETVTLDETQAVVGTLPYMSPEQLRNEKLDARSDIWATGCVLYEMATGHRPFTGQGPTLIDEILNKAPSPPSQLNRKVSLGLEAIIQKSLEKDRTLRYTSAREIAVDLHRLWTASPSQSHPVVEKPSPLWKRTAAITAALLLVGGGAAVYSVLKPEAQPRIVGTHVLTNTGNPKGNAFIRPLVDRGSIYFFDRRPSGGVQLAVPAAGGEVSAPPGNEYLRDISRDGSQLLLYVYDTKREQNDVWIQSVPAGTPRLVLKDICDAIWGADGRSIFFRGGNPTGHYRASADGTGVERLASLNECHGAMHLSPNGTRIRFTSPSPGHALWEIGTDGRNLHQILGGRKDAFGGTWSPDGKYYFFSSWDGERWSLWAVSEAHHWWKKAEGPQPEALTFGPVSFGVPAISSDGRQLYAVGNEPHGALSVYDAKSGKFVPYLGGISVCDVNFSRDGQWIACVTYPEGTLWRSRIDGSERRQLTVPPLAVMSPHWSPDGKLIAFYDRSNGDRHQMYEGTPRRIYVVGADGGGMELLLAGEFQDPSWSPDGNSIVYDYMATEPGSEVRILDRKTQKSTTVPGSHGMWCPRWSPDGKYLLAVVGWPSSKLALFNFASNTWQEVISKGFYEWPAWSRDSKFIYAHDKNSDSLVRIDISNRKKEVITSFQGFRRTTYYLDRWNLGWYGLTPDDRPLTTRDTGIQELYALDLEYK